MPSLPNSDERKPVIDMVPLTLEDGSRVYALMSTQQAELLRGMKIGWDTAAVAIENPWAALALVVITIPAVVWLNRDEKKEAERERRRRKAKQRRALQVVRASKRRRK